MPKQFLAILLIGLLSVVSLSQTARRLPGFIVGRVTERSTGQPVPAKISTAGGKAETDEKGNFRIEIEPGVYAVKVESDGFQALVVNNVGVTGGRDTVVNASLDITLLANVEVRSEVFAENSDQTVSNVTLRREDLRTTPGTGGDPLRAINSQPAVTATSAEFADLIVRGGTTDENLTFIDNIPVRDFTYFTDQYDGSRGGRASILAPDVFEKAEFSAGGFGVRYGDKMSSALDVTVREANRRKVQGVFFADSGTVGGSVDLPLGKRGSWLFSARRSYIDVALDIAGIANKDIIGYPRTLDFTNKLVYDLTPRNKLTFTGLYFFETFNQTELQALNIGRRTDRFRMRRTSQRNVFGATLSTTVNSKTLAQTTVWTNVSHNDGSFFQPFTSAAQRIRDLRDSQSGFKEDVSAASSAKFRFSFGGGIYLDQANYYSYENSGISYSPLEEEYRAPRRESRFILGTRTSADLYGQVTGYISPRFSVTPGVRIDHYGLTGETLASPRFAARYSATGKLSFTFSTGLYRQPPDLFRYSLTPNNQKLRSQSAAHIIGGMDWLYNENTRIRVEAYRKTYKNLIEQPLAATPGFIANGNYFNSGKGTASGFELSVQKALGGFLSGQASYGYVRSTRSVTSAGTSFPSDFARPHQLTLIGLTGFKGFSVAAKFRIASGLPYTNRTAVQTAPGSGIFIQRILTAAAINSLRLPNFASLDIRAEKRFSFRRVSLSPYIDIFNITNHRSVVLPDYELYRRNVQFLSENKRLPIFGFRFEF